MSPNTTNTMEQINEGDIAIIGCGASCGFLLSFLFDNPAVTEQKILIIDKNKEPFKKILATGNGRCNFSNVTITGEHYFSFSAEKEWKEYVLKSVKELDLSRYLHHKGMPSYRDEFGRIMPYTNSSATIHKYFKQLLQCPNINYFNYAEATRIEKQSDEKYVIDYRKDKNNYKVFSKKVIFAAGGNAYPQLGTDGSSFNILEKLGHTITHIVPGIVPLLIQEKSFQKLHGLKAECEISFKGYSRKGGILFTRYGISGPNTLYASNMISAQLLDGPVKIKVNFLPEEYFTPEYFLNVLKQTNSGMVFDAFCGAVNKALVSCVMDYAGNFWGHVTSTCPRNFQNNIIMVEKICTALKNVYITIIQTRGFKEAQVSLGGITTSEINPQTFESRICKGLYIIGEAIDFTGSCGGYNLHWCASSARTVSRQLHN